MRLRNSFSNSTKFAVAAFALLNLMLLTTGSTFALPSNELDSSMGSLKVADGRGGGIRTPTTIINFMASQLCSATTDKCIEISGSGTLRFNDELKAKGRLMAYNEGEQSLFTPSYGWTAKKLMNANEMRVHFKASSPLGTFDVAITEGKGPNSGLVCIWGTLNGVTGENETLCTNKVRVYID
jgi:hypothetical protein